MCFRKRNAKMQKELEDAAKDTKGLPNIDLTGCNAACMSAAATSVPTKPYIHFVSIASIVNWFDLRTITYFLCAVIARSSIEFGFV